MKYYVQITFSIEAESRDVARACALYQGARANEPRDYFIYRPDESGDYGPALDPRFRVQLSEVNVTLDAEVLILDGRKL